MAKGDDKRARNMIDWQGNLAQEHLNNLRNESIGENQALWAEMFRPSAMQGMQDYGGLMDMFKGQFGDVMGKAKEFTETGGLSDADKASIRSRAISPTRAVYANAQANVDRQRALQGGYSPNYTAATAKMARDMSQGLSDASTNAEAAIAEMAQRGKLSGLSSMGSTLGTGMSGLTGLYGQAPGLANMFGNQFLNSFGQRIDLQGLQNQLGLGRIGATINAGQLPGKWEHTFGRIKDVGNFAAGLLSPWG